MDNQELIEDYCSGMSINGCSRKYDIGQAEVRGILSRNNIKIRNRSEQNIFSNSERGYKLNHCYFDDLDLTKAYYLGFIASNGCVYEKNNVIKISLSNIDYDFLNGFKCAIAFCGKIHQYTTNKGFEIAELKFSSQHTKQTLARYSILPKKTYRAMSMREIPEELKGAFVKGYFDGNGSFSHIADNTSAILKICAYRNELLNEFKDWFAAYFNNQYNSRVYNLRRKTDSIYSWEMSTLPSIALLQYFYSLDTPCLLRKKQKFEDYMAFRIEKLDPRARTTFRNKVEKMC